MKRLLLLASLILASCLPANAQSYTAVTGTVTDVNAAPYVSGTLAVSFSNTTGQQALFGGNANFQKNYTVTLDSTGSFSLTLPSNAVIAPPGTNWSFTACTSDGENCFTTLVSISGASQNISASLINTSRITFGLNEANQPPCPVGQTIVAVSGSEYGCSSVATPGGNIAFTGNNTHSGTETFNQLSGCQHVSATQTFAQALAAAGSSGCLVVDPGTYTVSVNSTIPTGVGISFTEGGILSIANSVTLIINSVIYASPDTQIFTYVGTGVVVLGGTNAVVSSAWFPGADIGIQINQGLLALQNGGGNAGGWIDSRHYTAAQTSSTNPFIGITIPFTLDLPCASTTMSVPWIHQGSQQFVRGCINSNPSELLASASWPNIAITSSSQTLTTVTVTTASAHPFATHDLVCISGTTTDRRMEGCVFVTGSADNTHFTFTNDLSSTRSSTGGIVTRPMIGVGTDASGVLSRVRYSNVNFDGNGKTGTIFANVGGEEGSGLDQWVSKNFVGYGIFQCGSADAVNFSLAGGNNKYSQGHVLYNSGSNNTTGFSAFRCSTASKVTLEATSLVTNGSVGTGNVNIYNNNSSLLISGIHCESSASCLTSDASGFTVADAMTTNGTVTNMVVLSSAGEALDADLILPGTTATVVNNVSGGHTLTGTITHYRASSNGQETWVKDDAAKLLNVSGSGIVPGAPGTGDIGSTSLPFGNLWLGTAATNNFKFQPAATAAARVISIPDPLGATNLVLTPAAGTIRSSLHISDQGTACANGNIALSAGWGTTAAPTNARGQGQTCEWTITASGTGQAASPTITWTVPTALPSASVLCEGSVKGGTQASPSTIDHTTLSATAPVFTYNGTPGAGLTLFVLLRCGP